MSDLQKKNDDEIDLLDLIEKVWNGKWKIVLFIIAGIFITYVYIIKNGKNFIATTEIRPIKNFEADKYKLLNATFEDEKLTVYLYNRMYNYGFESNKSENKTDEVSNTNEIFKITEESLLNLYIENIQQNKLFELGIKSSQLINKEDFDDPYDYEYAVRNFASNISILKPKNIDGKEKGKIIPYHTINGQYDDIKKWNKLLVFVDFNATKGVKDSIINRFETIISIKKQRKKFQNYDLNTKIINVKQDYEQTIKYRLAFLAEQASIARKLGIQKNTIENQTFNTVNTGDLQKKPYETVSNLKTDNSFYLSGYEAIEEEMRLINTRKNKTSFMKELLGLEQQKRDLEQDKTIQRANDLFGNTPIKQDTFKATSANVSATEYVYDNKPILYYIIAIILSGMIGVFYVLIANSFANRKKTIVTS